MKVARMSCTLYALSHLQSLTKMLQKIYIVNMKFMVIWALGARPRVRVPGTSFVQWTSCVLHCLVPALTPAVRKHYNCLLCAVEGIYWLVSWPRAHGAGSTGAWGKHQHLCHTAQQHVACEGSGSAEALAFATEKAGRGVLRSLRAGSCSHVPGLWSWSHKEAS